MLGQLRNYVLAALVGFSTVLAVAAVLHEVLGVGERLAVAVALLTAFGINFTLLRRFVFPGQLVPVRRQLAETAVTSLGFRGVEYLIFLALNLALGYLLATALALGVSNLAKFAIYRGVVFNSSRRSTGVALPPGS